MKSIIQREKECFICRNTYGLEDHHIFTGPNRKHAEKYGLKVWLCHAHHTAGPMAVHRNRAVMRRLQQIGQAAFERTHTRAEFLKIFRRNYCE